MRRRSPLSVTALLAWATLGLASKKSFSVHDDVLAFPQFDVLFPDEYVLESDARARLEYAPFSNRQTDSSQPSSPSPSASSDVPSQQRDDHSGHAQQQSPLRDGRKDGSDNTDDTSTPIDLDDSIEGYEEMVLNGQRYLCSLPRVESVNETETPGLSPAEQETELARATDRGLELLKEMEGRCMYYVAGWWSYSFCYMNQIRQFHALPPGGAVPVYPPAEDPTAHAFVLGRFRRSSDEQEEEGKETKKKSLKDKKAGTKELAKLRTEGDSRYLVQYLEDGTTCDLTGRDRRIEVQFHCHPQTTDRIGWIKEVTTCSYLMVIYTPRLCNDVAFQPPREDVAHEILCREIIAPEEVEDWEAAKQAAEENQQLVQAGAEPPLPIVGDIEVGAMKLVGKEGKRIERGKVASAGEEKVEVIARREGGQIQRLSKEELRKFNLDPEKVEALKKQLEDLAKGKDWKLEVVDSGGERGLRGIIDTEEDIEDLNDGSSQKAKDGKGTGDSAGRKKGEDGDEKETGRNQKRADDGDDDIGEKGSEETFKEEL
ncbi:hypothetical protein AJ80_07880 [Polytolypa hystricis UAMH7299]|uniref:Endoplasmic reticulum lectin n=1 Tax=Polytolypa hystricis (strain UAMH7299) TaxID=1447883 RepID=A0A2B7X9E0_POLH7|nr:hypothetical protein AJ80_07880 [Polytolypa hystricis UAMH7299]